MSHSVARGSMMKDRNGNTVRLNEGIARDAHRRDAREYHHGRSRRYLDRALSSDNHLGTVSRRIARQMPRRYIVNG